MTMISYLVCLIPVLIVSWLMYKYYEETIKIRKRNEEIVKDFQNKLLEITKEKSK